jgi:hypothetical protein
LICRTTLIEKKRRRREEEAEMIQDRTTDIKEREF